MYAEFVRSVCAQGVCGVCAQGLCARFVRKGFVRTSPEGLCGFFLLRFFFYQTLILIYNYKLLLVRIFLEEFYQFTHIYFLFLVIFDGSREYVSSICLQMLYGIIYHR